MVDWITQIKRPAGNDNALWLVNTYVNIDDAIEDPTVGDGITCYADQSDDNEEQIWNIDDVDEPFMWSIDRVVLKFYCWEDEEPPVLDVRIFVGSSWSSTQLLFLDDILTPSWKTLTFDGTWDKADFEADFKVGVKTGAMNGNEESHIDALYATVHGYPWSA